jgi:uncharacterized protein (TIGR02145 family)
MQKKNILLLTLTSLVYSGLALLQAQTVTDAGGTVYPTVTIGKQVWMAENLRTIKYNDGTPIPLVTDDRKWGTIKTPAYCWLNNDIENKDIYGALYNWYTIDTKKLCPKGWHVPSDTEWGAMITFLGDVNTAGDKLKEKGSDHWKNSLTIASNEYDFTALPAGMRLQFGTFPEFAQYYAVWWSSTGSDGFAWNRGLYFSSSKAYRGKESMNSGFSVRCLKDF